jgi:hypothetical protein
MNLAHNLQRDGRFSMAARLLDAQRESLVAAQSAVLDIGKMMARRNRAGCHAAMVLAAAHYRNAGEAALAAHWDARAKRLAAGG